MDWLPENYDGTWTLRSTVSREGIGLHSGKNCKVSLYPSDSVGIKVLRNGESRTAELIHPSQVVSSQLCTTLNFGNKTISTVEHLFAALVGCGVTNVNIDVSGTEIPLLDGSAIGWVEAIREAGLMAIKNSKRQIPVLEKPIVIYKGESVISATPSETFKLIGIVDFPYKAIGKQMFSINLTPRNFVKDLAPARTFGFKDQVDHLISKGLIKGGNLENSLVCDGNFWLNPPLRFKDEPVRHKLLDLIGDLAFVGLPKAQVLVYRGSHALHAQLATAFLREFSTLNKALD